MAENKEIIISYSTLFELLRREKDREELQKLQETFFDEVRSYVQETQRIASGSTLTNFEERSKVEKELYNIKKILKELYEKREKKVVSMALDKSKIKTNIVDSASMLKEEKELFDSLVNLLDENRQYVALRMFSQDSVNASIRDAQEEPKIEPKVETKTEVSNHPPQIAQIAAELDQKEADETAEPVEHVENLGQNGTKLVRFMHAVPKFVGKELEEYGPFEEEDIANLPADIAKVLIDKSRAEEISQ